MYMFRNIAKLLLIAACSVCIYSCGSGNKGAGKENSCVGVFTDEFGNRFELREDYTASIVFAGNDKTNNTKWRDGENHDSPFATIEYNGDPSYYFLRDGFLYRHREDMEKGRCAIKIAYE